MGTINESVNTANSAIRTLLLTILVAGAGFAGWQGYSLYNEPLKKLAEKDQALKTALSDLEKRQQQIEALSTDLQAKTEELQRTKTSLRLLKMSHRIARLRVLDQQPIPDSNPPRVMTTLEFFEVNDEGIPIDDKRRQFEIEGTRVYVDCLVAKFEDKYVEQADLERATAICMFQRIFGEYQQPQDGFLIDEVGSSPTSYARGGQISEFEQKIWDDFWEFAADRQKAAEIGIRAAHADAPSTKVKQGVTYQLELRATGEFTLMPVAEGT